MQGRKPGYVFGRSVAGQGYYPDVLEQQKAQAEAAAQVRPRDMRLPVTRTSWDHLTDVECHGLRGTAGQWAVHC